MTRRVLEYRPLIPSAVFDYLRDVFDSGCLAGTCGRFVKLFEDSLARFLGVRYVVACSSGTSALHTCLRSIGVSYRDVVLVPGFTFVATASSVLHAGAVPIFVDIDVENLDIDASDLEYMLKRLKDSSHVKAVTVVHIGGVPARLSEIMNICERYNVELVEDCAQALGAEYNGRKVGTFGKASAFSFYPTKTITTGEGGAVATSDENVHNIARMFINHGEDRRYHYVMLGYNYRMSEINAAIGLAQLERIESYIESRVVFAEKFIKEVSEVLGDLVRFQRPPPGSRPCWNLIEMILNLEKLRISRDRLVQELRGEGLKMISVAYPEPLNMSPLFQNIENLLPYEINIERDLLYRKLKNCTYVCSRVITLLVPPGLTEDDAYAAAEIFINVIRRFCSSL
ncbi:MAG: DegT/DnrJ/EryC1/StrS family aminotransferase [Crenarchaeota archaeon]|nr:DegT/DnrJ/EryC1/StrS family aminotransferase [Thermoproteota archaeon]